MKPRRPEILFLVTGLAPGRNGVGDVTRLLAGYLEKIGYACTLISIADPHLPSGLTEHVEERDGEPRLIQLSSLLPWKERVVRVRAWVDKTVPDLISLHFVAYSLNVKGIVFPVTPYLQQMTMGYPLHVMFHELWVGAERGASLRHRGVGFFQRMAIQDFVKKTKPKLVQASNPTYVGLLHQAGIPASRLPIASGIPIRSTTGAWFGEECSRHGLTLQEGNRGNYWLFCHFGTLHPQWSPEPLLTRLLEAGDRAAKKVVFIGIGRLGHGEELWHQIAQAYADRINIFHLGARTEREVSEVFLAVDYGISATPWQIMGKSSVAVAMLEHGLPVIVNRELSYHLPESEQDPGEQGLIRMKEGLVEPLLAGIPRRPAQSRLPEIAEQFLRDNGLVTSSP